MLQTKVDFQFEYTLRFKQQLALSIVLLTFIRVFFKLGLAVKKISNVILGCMRLLFTKKTKLFNNSTDKTIEHRKKREKIIQLPTGLAQT